jgi:Ni/Fe-hydrogenase subunit HybB-like protein
MTTDLKTTHLIAFILALASLAIIYIGMLMISADVGQLHHIAGPTTTPTHR